MKTSQFKPFRSQWYRYGLVALALACSGDGPTAPGTPPAPPPPPAPAPVAAVQLDASALSLLVGQTRTVSAVAVDASGNQLTGRQGTWSSDNPLVADVSLAGVVTAVAAGTAAIRATIEGKTATLPVTVALVPVKQLSVTLSAGSAYVGASVTASAVARDSAGGTLSGRVVTWTTSNSAVATISSGGVVTTLAPGTVEISAEVEGVKSGASLSVTLVPVATVSVSPSSRTLYVGQTVDLTAGAKDSAGNSLTGRAVTWSSGNAAIAAVSAAGVVTAVAPGVVTITATVEGKTATASITVALVPVATVSVAPAAKSLYVGQTVDLSAGARDSAGNSLTGRAVSWSTGNSSVATVNAGGVVTAMAPGTVTITATVEGITGTASVTVALVPVATVSVSPGTETLYQTATVQLTASAQDSVGGSLTGRGVTWSTGNAAVATVSSAGIVAAIAQGEAVITATVEGKTAQAAITVRHDPIVFLHGFGGSGTIWATMTARFTADGWRSADLLAWSYNSLQSNVTTAALLKTVVDSVLAATGAKRVDIVTHSMGGLPSRYYLKNLSGTASVDAWVSLGGPNHGTDTAPQCAGIYVSCAEMVIGSTFLTALNSGDETPGAVRYATWWSACDATINPDDSVLLSGATNTEAACLGHSVLYSDLTVYGQVKAWIR